MFNNIYEKIKSFIKNNYKELLVYLIILFIITFPLPYYIYVGGGTIDLESRIELESNEKGSYNLAYVSQVNATIPTYLLSFLIDSWEVVKVGDVMLDDSETKSDIETREKLYLEEANNNAIINAYSLANREIDIKSNCYKVVYVSEESDTTVKVGDTLLTVNGISVDDNNEYKEYLKSLKLGSDLDVVVKRNGKEVNCSAKLISVNGESVIGLYLVNIIDYEVNPEIKLNFKWNESGPSGGFMLSLAIYDKLIEEDLTKGRKIVGTGTIDQNGNVGEIGGVQYKLMGAVKDNADIFFVPTNNYEEAINFKNKKKYDIEIVEVKTIQDAINYLKVN